MMRMPEMKTRKRMATGMMSPMNGGMSASRDAALRHDR
jgi:hypothetical protein